MRERLPGWQWLGLGLLCLSGFAWAQQARLEGVHLSLSGNRTRIVFSLSKSIHPDLFMLRDPARLVVDMPNTTKADGKPDAWRGKGVVERLRSGIRHGDDLRVVLDLAQLDVKPESYTLLPGDHQGHRLVVDLYTQSRQQQAEPKSVSGHGSTPVQANRKTSYAKPEPVAYTPAAPTRRIVVAVDPGHGGHDPGAIGPDGVEEKHVTMAISRKLAAMIDDQPHMHAILTRKSDTYVGLRERTLIARHAHADLFVSIHANASTDPQAHGVAVFALSLRGATSERARLLARRENSTLVVGGANLEQKDARVASFILDLAQSATIEASLDVGRRVLNDLDRFTVLHQSRVEQAAFVVLKSPDIPSILVETGFITDPAGERKLQSNAYQTKIARAVLRGIKGYFDSYRPGTMIVKGVVHEVKAGETLSGIAQTYDVDVARLREYNDIKGSLIRVGQQLRIPPPARQQIASLR